MKRITFFLLLCLLISSCTNKFIRYTLFLNVKEYNDNKLVSCGYKRVTIEHNDSYVQFLDMSLRNRGGVFMDSHHYPYTYFWEINNSGLILSTVAANKKSYILSTKGKCSQ